MIEKLTKIKASTDGLPFQYTDNTDNDMSMILFLPDSPVLEGEDNYQQQLQAMQMRRIVRTVVGPMTLLSPITPTATGVSNEIRLTAENETFYAAINGIIKTVAAYDTPVSGAKVEGGNRVTLTDWTVAGRQDLVYLEIWFEEVMSPTAVGTADTTVYKHGMVHGFTDFNNLRVTSYGELHETARRIQLRGKIRTAPGTNTVQGLNAKDSATYSFEFTDGHYRAGVGDITSASALNSVDGYVYAIPLVQVVRGATAAEMTSLTVAANSTVNLQALAAASEALGDMAQFGSDIDTLKSTQTNHTSRLYTLDENVIFLRNEQRSSITQFTTLNNKIADLEKRLAAARNKHVHSTRSINSTATNVLGPNQVWAWGESMVELPPNHTLVIDKVLAYFPLGCQFRLLLYSVNTQLGRTWTWEPTLANGGSYNYNGMFLQRSRESQRIVLPEYDSSSVTQNILVRTNLVIGNTNLTFSARESMWGEVTLELLPK